jgi:hypothetical protein
MAEHPAAGSATLGIGTRVGSGVVAGQTSCLEPVAPNSLLYGTVRQGPTNLVGLDAPDQGVDQGPSRPLGLTWRRSILTLRAKCIIALVQHVTDI